MGMRPGGRGWGLRGRKNQGNNEARIPHAASP